MHYAKFDYLIVIILIITLWFVANAFLIKNISETTPARKTKLLKKLQELEDLQNNHNTNIAKFLMLSSCSAGCCTCDIGNTS